MIDHVPEDVEATAPLSFQQEWMAASKLRHPNPGWNMLLPWRLTGSLDRAALCAAIDAVIARHEALRTTHAIGADGRAVQHVHRHRPGRTGEVDLRALPATERGAALAQLARERHSRPHDHVRGPLFEPTLVRWANDEAYLLFAIDHSICDGWSVGVLQAELSAAYNGLVTGRGLRLLPLPGRYRDLAVEQRALAAAGAFDDQLELWADRLTPGPLGQAAAPPAGVDGYGSAQHPLVVPAETAERLRRLRGTLFMTLLAALAAVLARRTATGEVAVTSMAAGRARAEHQRLIGLFANPVVVPTCVAGGDTFATLLDRVRPAVLTANARPDVPFPLIARRTGVTAPEIWLNVAPRSSMARFRGLTVDTAALTHDYPIDVPAGAWRGEMLIVNLADTGAAVSGLIDYNRHQLDAPTVAGIAEDFVGVLSRAVQEPGALLAEPGTRPPLP
ncbi:condensation domain-containing protein [Dactylosporangium sp. NPDC050688]|uniref:condensation domain-containing protein n=1 Tax=Dactylosporangium sp. NPDC050688 TaxID=3157217 RepID=UPI0033FA7263